MKELSTEEKAKRYDEALEKARQLCVYPTSKPFIGDLQDIFPELKESEDEKVIRDIKVVLECSATKFFKEEGKMPIWYDRAVAWLEKQGKQKPVDKVEAKFNLYDWVVTDKGDTVQIGAVNNGYYTLCNGMDFNMSYVDKCWHKWTIKDAKDGDVLDANGAPFIHKKHDKDYVYFYCGVNLAGEFIEANGIDTWNNNYKVYPATKEQRDKLEKAMLKAGYKWNADKKELIKLL